MRGGDRHNLSVKTWLRRAFFVAAAFAGSYFFLESLSAPRAQTVVQSQPSAVVLPPEENDTPLSMLEGNCPVVWQPFCLDNRDSWAFMREDEKEPERIIVSETPLPPFAPDAASVRDISRKIAAMVAADAVIESEDFSALEEPEFSNEQLEKLYEEKLPDDVIEDEPPHAPGYFVHHNQKAVKDINIRLQRKPFYFGPRPVIAVVIDDMGISPRRTRDILSLHAPLTASFLTYGPHLSAYLEQARQAGQEIIVHVPMEPKSKADVAPDVLTVAMSGSEVREGLEIMLEKFGPIAGINNHMGSRFTENRAHMQVVMEVLKERQLFFLDSKTSPHSVGKEIARKNGVAYAHRHVFLDNNNDFAYITRQLRLTEKIAARNGYAIAIGHPKSQTFKALEAWLPTLKDKNIKLVHLSEIVKELNRPH